MRYTQVEKLEIIRAVEESDLPAKRTLDQLQVSRSSFYRWYRAYAEHGAEGLGLSRELATRKPTANLEFQRLHEQCLVASDSNGWLKGSPGAAFCECVCKLSERI